MNASDRKVIRARLDIMLNGLEDEMGNELTFSKDSLNGTLDWMMELIEEVHDVGYNSGKLNVNQEWDNMGRHDDSDIPFESMGC